MKCMKFKNIYRMQEQAAVTHRGEKIKQLRFKQL